MSKYICCVMAMLRLIYLFILLIICPLSAQAQDMFKRDTGDHKSDPLKDFRVLLNEQLNPTRATVERVFNPLGDGESLLVRAYVTGPEELVFRPLFNESPENAQSDSFILRTLPGTELKEVLINFEPDTEEYRLYFGQFHYGVSPDLSQVTHINARPESAPFLAQNFQTLFIDHPSSALGLRYLTDIQRQQNLTAIMQLKKEYRDSMTDQLLINSNGHIVNPYRLIPYEGIAVTPVWFIEQYHLDTNGTFRYYVQPEGLQSFRLGIDGTPLAESWISRQAMQSYRLLPNAAQESEPSTQGELKDGPVLLKANELIRETEASE
ncbi:hypothetical protein [Oceanospirillum sediminis]|uniref:Uncharacterized protein n=1 Tax=Oceanospirillum sediminis TaxID=2760088 RepID=A0A839IKK3_9GAMM|nr:hypothetical protein [Oceanospirillum sediminis]MBB1485254.1 hypothetical protein [Oceanospirillum sediminis]